ncbi:MAG: transketolase [Armatimonadetes bacterium]|nr:transketolase [Armatimonadota bacterium]
MEKNTYIKKLEDKCRQFRKDLLIMLENAGSGHSGGSLSSIEILAALYFLKMKHDPSNINWPDRDYFILSKGHICPALYTILAHAGYFPKEELMTLRKLGSILQGHPHRLKTPGVEVSSGSLGQGLSIANGIALSLKLDKKINRVYCLIGDGESQEGQIWEAAMTAAHYKLDNVCAILDYNNLQIDGWIEEVKGIAEIRKKWESFNWHVIEVDGHNIAELYAAYNHAEQIKGKPTIIIAWTIKGKGISFMENVAGWHGKPPNKEELKQALIELEN